MEDNKLNAQQDNINEKSGDSKAATPLKNDLSRGFPYEILYKEDGVFYQAARSMLADITTPLVLYDLSRRQIDGLRQGEIIIKLHQKATLIRLADEQEEKPVPAKAFVEISADKMAASLKLLPPTDGSTPEYETIMEQVTGEWGIQFGLDEEALKGAVSTKQYYIPVEIALGQEARQGQNGRIDLLFNTVNDYKPIILEDGSVDYRNLNIFTEVRAGDVVAVRIPAEQGIPGKNVLGEAIHAKDGTEAKIPRTKNVNMADDGISLVSTKDGRVELERGVIVVSDVFVVNGDVDMGIGNIDFRGDVKVSGGIIAGLTIKADGNVEIGGTVEGAEIYAGNDIILRKGIQGMGKANIKAGGNVISRFIERCTIEAGGDVCSDYIVHSNVKTNGSVILRGRRGRLIGGYTRAGKEVIARTLGTPTGEKTIIELNMSVEIRNALKAKIEEIEKLQSQINKVLELLKISEGRQNDSEENKLMHEKLISSHEYLIDEYEAVRVEIEKLEQRLNQASRSMVHVYGEAYHDVKITIDGIVYMLRETIEYATFKCKEGAIVFTACETGVR